MVALTPRFEGDDELYAYAIGVVAGTAVQLAMCLPPLRRIGFPLRISLRLPQPAHPPRADPHAAREPRARADQREPGAQLGDRLPRLRRGAGRDRQGVPHLHAPAGDVLGRGRHGRVPGARAARQPPRPARHARADRHRDAPDRAAADPERGGDRRARDADGAARLRARRVRRRVDRARSPRRCSGSRSRCPFSGFNLLLTRTFFSLQRPWLPTKLALASVAVNAVVSLALYEPLGIAGIVLGTTVSNVVMTLLLGHRLRRELGGLEAMRTLRAVALMTAAGGAARRGRLRHLVRARRRCSAARCRRS